MIGPDRGSVQDFSKTAPHSPYVVIPEYASKTLHFSHSSALYSILELKFPIRGSLGLSSSLPGCSLHAGRAVGTEH